MAKQLAWTQVTRGPGKGHWKATNQAGVTRWQYRYRPKPGANETKATFDSLAELEDFVTTLRAAGQSRSSAPLDNRTMTFGQFVIDHYVPSRMVTRDTAKSNTETLNRIRRLDPDFLDQRLGLITETDFRMLLQAHRTTKWGKPYGEATVRVTWAFVNKVMRYAVRANQLRQWDVEIPDAERPRNSSIMAAERLPQADEIGPLVMAMDALYRAPTFIACLLGLRSGELRGLTLEAITGLRRDLRGWHVDPEVTATITVSHQLKDDDGSLRDTKSRSGQRILRPLPVTMEDLARHLNTFGPGPEVDCWLDRRGSTIVRRTLVFRGRGKLGFISSQTLRNVIAGAAEATIGRPITPHVLRHFYATVGCQDLDPKDLQYRMGHATSSITMDQYAAYRPRAEDPSAHRFAAIRASVSDLDAAAVLPLPDRKVP